MTADSVSPRVLGRVVSVSTAGPKTWRDARGDWVSSIARDPVNGPPLRETQGFVGDQPTQRYHGSLETADCLQSLALYPFWNEHYRMSLAPGGVGENLTLDGMDESQACVGDVFQIGGAWPSDPLAAHPVRDPGAPRRAGRLGRADAADAAYRALLLTLGGPAAGGRMLLDA